MLVNIWYEWLIHRQGNMLMLSPVTSTLLMCLKRAQWPEIKRWWKAQAWTFGCCFKHLTQKACVVPLIWLQFKPISNHLACCTYSVSLFAKKDFMGSSIRSIFVIKLLSLYWEISLCLYRLSVCSFRPPFPTGLAVYACTFGYVSFRPNGPLSTMFILVGLS